MKLYIEKVVSGGQTGADRAALDAARITGIKTGGYCPKYCMTENGPDASLKSFGLIQTRSKDYNERTVLNIIHSDGTVVFSKKDKGGNVTGIGTLLTVNTAKNYGKPCIINPGKKEFKEWIVCNGIKTLNVAGNRQSQNRNVYNVVFNFLKTGLLIPPDFPCTETKEYRKFVKDIKSIKDNRVSGSVTLLNKLVDAVTDYVKSTKVHSSVVYKNIKINTLGFKEDDTQNMLVLKGFIDEFLGKFKKVNSSNDNKRKYLTYFVNYKKRWDDIGKKIAENVLREINFIDKTVVLFSNSSSVVSIFKALTMKKIFPIVLQCESNPEKEGLVQAKILKDLGFRVKVLDEKNISKYLNKIDFAILGCDGYNGKYFTNKRGTLDLVKRLNVAGIHVYLLSDSRKYTKESFKNSGNRDKSLFERIPLKMITKVITEQILPANYRK